ncbi:hypothetical protein C8R43DRAFT_990228 [Mycena crocata]|nr:hypothetical protein C8R43DRAFT_990228 [Mycena crocata]
MQCGGCCWAAVLETSIAQEHSLTSNFAVVLISFVQQAPVLGSSVSWKFPSARIPPWSLQPLLVAVMSSMHSCSPIWAPPPPVLVMAMLKIHSTLNLACRGDPRRGHCRLLVVGWSWGLPGRQCNVAVGDLVCPKRCPKRTQDLVSSISVLLPDSRLNGGTENLLSYSSDAEYC